MKEIIFQKSNCRICEKAHTLSDQIFLMVTIYRQPLIFQYIYHIRFAILRPSIKIPKYSPTTNNNFIWTLLIIFHCWKNMNMVSSPKFWEPFLRGTLSSAACRTQHIKTIFHFLPLVTIFSHEGDLSLFPLITLVYLQGMIPFSD